MLVLLSPPDDWRAVWFDDGVPVVAALDLRSLLVLLLLQRARPTTVADLVAGVERAGFAFLRRPSKEVSDALRWEVRRGRVVRHGRGLYGPGYVAKSTRHRMGHRIADLRRRARLAAAATAVLTAPSPAPPNG